MNDMKRLLEPLLFCVLVMISILLFYTAYDNTAKAIVFKNLADVLLFKDLSHTLSELNKVLALTGIGLVSISMAIGPLSVLFPAVFSRYVRQRRFLGVAGVTCLITHLFYGILIFYQFSATKIFFENPKLLGVVFALPAFLIFLAMALTSNAASIRALGAKRWKTLHRFGYLALALAALHFIIMETKSGQLAVRPYGKVFLALPIMALILKLISIVYKRKSSVGDT